MFKTRTRATRACSASRVRVNGLIAKPHRLLAIGDRVEFAHGDWSRLLEVVELRSKPLPKAEAARVYLDHSPPRPEPAEPAASERGEKRQSWGREPGLGRPTKKERRELEKWRRGHKP